MRIERVVGIAAFAVALLGGVTDVSADVKVYHGSVCVPTSGSPVNYGQFGITSSMTNMWYASQVWCPVTRDRINSTSSLTDLTIEGWNEASNNGNSLLCTLYNQQEDLASGSQTALTYVDFDSKSTSTLGNFTLSFSAPTSSGNEGAMALTCGLSFQDKIYHLHVNENNAATD